MQPGSFGSIVPDENWLVRKVQELERRLNEQAAADPFGPMGISPKAGGIDVVGFLETLRADGTVSLRMATGGGAFEVCDSTGIVVARFGLMENANPGLYGVEVLVGTTWVQIGAQTTTWATISGIPSTFPPSSHTHVGADITSGTVPQADGSQYGWTNNVAGTTQYAVWVGNDGGFHFGRNVSSIRYKENVRSHHTDPANVLALTPVLYDKISGGPDNYGLIAEQVAEHCPELISWFDGEIDSVRYDLLSVQLLNVVKHQDAQIQALAAAIPGFTLPAAAPVTANVPASMAPTPQPTPLTYTIQPQ
ncbi:tail fiber domain-containing protein [Arthrobacter sp. NPDC080073]|uniref:tail fiber domain-containing protein n=1 Tax=Arthrobacter sp. NPDC080073 TaxID=3155919 RepID=UPI00343035F8